MTSKTTAADLKTAARSAWQLDGGCWWSLGCLAALSAAACSAPESGTSPPSTGGSAGAPPVTTGGISTSGSGGTVAVTGGSVGMTGGSPPATGGSGGMVSATGGSGGMQTTGGVAPGTGGSSGMPATGGSAGAATTGGSGGTVGTNCTITPTSEISKAIATVGIVTWTTDLAGLSAARIEFGLDTNYGMTAPVGLSEPSYRTLLLGMKPSSMYHYRIVATGASGECASQDQTITTGAVINGLPDIEVTTTPGAALAGGFLMTGQYAQGGGQSGSPAYILDADGDFVWWFNIGSDVTGAAMSHDGKYMWINNANVPDGGANVHRVSMDGLEDEDFSDQFESMSHQMVVLPDETVAFYAYGDNGCDDIKERAPDGTVRTLINIRDSHGLSGDCHANTIQYSPEDNTLIFSDLGGGGSAHNVYVKVTRDVPAEVVWVLGDSVSSFTGDGASWTRQHGLDVLGLDRLLIFNNGPQGGTGDPSLAIEILLDLGAMTATRVWTYEADPRVDNDIMGDVQRMPNGNTIIAYSTKGLLHEVDATGNLLQELSWSLGGQYGYIIKRPDLYGADPK